MFSSVTKLEFLGDVLDMYIDLVFNLYSCYHFDRKNDYPNTFVLQGFQFYELVVVFRTFSIALEYPSVSSYMHKEGALLHLSSYICIYNEQQK